MKKIVVRTGFLSEDRSIMVLGTHYEIVDPGRLHIYSGSELVACFTPGKWNSVYLFDSLV